MTLVKVDGDDRMYSISKLGTSRTLPAPGQRFTIKFTELDFYTATNRIKGTQFGDSYIIPRGDPRAEEEDRDLMEDDGWVSIDVELWTAEPHPYKPDQWVQVKRYATGRYRVLLSCPHCMY
jgi:hypothetical protein